MRDGDGGGSGKGARAAAVAGGAQAEPEARSVQDGVLRDTAGTPFTFEILLQQGGSENQSIVDMYVQSLGRIGITPARVTGRRRAIQGTRRRL